MRTRLIILVFALYTLFPFGNGVAGPITGCIVFHQRDRQWPAAYQRVLLTPTRSSAHIEAYSGRDGCYYFPSVKPGSYELTVEYQRDKQSRRIDVYGSETKQFNFDLRQQ
jgi:hypothetical protein